jgi:hypothetical protein
LLLPGESERHYEELQKLIFRALEPDDVIETIWAKDIADAVFESERLKRLKLQFIESARRTCLKEAISKIVGGDPLDGLSPSKVAERFVNEAMQEASGDARIRDKLSQGGFHPDGILAEAYGKKLPGIESFERLIVGADRKRDGLIRQFDEYRNRRVGRRHSPPDIELHAEPVRG